MKRQRTDTFNGNDNKRLLPMIECFSNTQFEDLPNEVIYDIFDYLDFYHVYQSFYNLNTRFQSYFLESNVPRKSNLFLMSKTIFNRYNEDIILSNRQQIHTLRISNYFMFEKKSFSFSYQTSLRTLIIENIKSTDVKVILRQLTSLSNLTSLSISTLNAIRNINSFYAQIFRLSTLKYLKLLVGRKYPKFISPITINKHTSIEYLIFDHGMDLNELIALLSNTPCLRHLSAML
ncbi:unnamed protein product [Adineta steineri]|uniref:F-box domain-containing protein n=1 Tax=Adineta steineri TaxID=433720 RepID=A0A819RWR1_9BILA|nr:unnamed protein product [Adineta steineri]CAF4047302.1 unnamed protein product [Adineta steineri]